MSSNRQSIINVMGAVFALSSEEIPLDASPDLIESWDSVGHMNLILALEEEFGIRFPDDQIEMLISLDAIELSVGALVG